MKTTTTINVTKAQKAIQEFSKAEQVLWEAVFDGANDPEAALYAKVNKLVQQVKHEIALRTGGAERAAKWWKLTGGRHRYTESLDGPARFATEDGLNREVATWIFDNFGRHPDRSWDNLTEGQKLDRMNAAEPVLQKVRDALGDDAEAAIKAWADGRHDT